MSVPIFGTLSFLSQRAHLLTTFQVVISPAANGVPAESSFNSLSLIDRTAERNHNLIAMH